MKELARTNIMNPVLSGYHYSYEIAGLETFLNITKCTFKALQSLSYQCLLNTEDALQTEDILVS